MTELQRRAHAKINLALAVGRPDEAGMHPIASWMVPLELHDDVTVRRRSAGADPAYDIAWASEAPVQSAIDWAPETDLCAKAHRALEAMIGRALPAEVTVRKRIPAGGGLGGGSSDAAATLLALNDLFELGLDGAALRRVSASVGSDIAFFLDPESPSHAARGAFVGGLGDQIERVGPIGGLGGTGLTLLLPPFGCPTGAVYRAFDADVPARFRDAAVRTLIEEARARGSIDPVGLFNDLATPAAAVEPRLHPLLAWASANSGVHLSGSGSTLFALAGAPDGADPVWSQVARAPTQLAGTA